MEGIPQVEILTTQELIRRAISDLPILSATDIPLDDSCAICLTGFDTVLSEEAEMNASTQREEEMIHYGVTKLVDCGHMFCRKDLLEWIQGFHGSCPTCRNVFLNIRPPSESDGESSDGDYFPNDEEEEEEEEYWDDNEEEFDVDEMELDVDVDLDDVWDAHSELGTDDQYWNEGDTTLDSEADMSIGGEIAALADDDSEPAAEGADETLYDESVQEPK